MPTYAELLPATKTDPKGAGLDWTPTPTTEGGPVAGVLAIKQKRGYTSYVVCEFPTDWPGRAFHFAKLTAGRDKTEERYDCFLAANGRDRRCDCKGFGFTGRCKHLAALDALVANGWV